VFRNEKVIDLACFVDVNFDECTCMSKPQMSKFVTLIHEYILEFEV